MSIGVQPSITTDSVGQYVGPAYVNDCAPSGYIAAANGAPTTTNAASETIYTLSSQASRFLIQNNTSATLYVDLDATASTASIQIPAGQSWRDDIQVTSFHLYTASSQPINAASGVVIRGWS